MNIKKIKKLAKLHWIKIFIAGVMSVLFIALVFLVIIGTNHFLSLESFYKKMSLSAVPLQLFLSVVTAFIFAGIYMGFNYWFMFGGGFAKMGQKRIKSEAVNIKWSDVIGMESAKKEAEEVIQLIKDRKHLQRIGGKIIKGLLMVGPPGCGKTYLAKAIATETGVPFLAAVGSEFMGIFVGVGSSKIRSLFKQARVLAEIEGGCIIFIDEIDTIARPRVSIGGTGAGMDYNATVNQLLTEMDGLRQKDTNIVIIAATNVSEDELDPALMRAGRFDRKIYVGKPNLKERKKLFDFYLQKVQYETSIDTEVLARKTIWFSPADIANMVRESSLLTVREKREKISFKDLSAAYDRVVFGLKSDITLSKEDKKWTAYHEAGHAIIAYLGKPTDDVVKATIIPRKGLLGYAHPVAREESYTQNKEYLLAEIKTSLGGYAAEKIKFGSTSSGVSADFAHALRIAHDMVYSYGMGPSGIIGNFAGSNYYSLKPTKISEELKMRLDNDAQTILNNCLKEVEDVLSKEKELLEYFAQELLKKEELEYDEIVEIFKTHGKERPQSSFL